MSYEPSPYINTPAPEKKIWRYLSIDKFMSMLSSNNLHIPNVSLFNDRYEGMLSDKSKEEAQKVLLVNQNKLIKQDEKFNEEIQYIASQNEQYKSMLLKNHYSFHTLYRYFSWYFMFCSCWFQRDKESYLMWSQYGDNAYPTSVAIQTTVGNLIKSLKPAQYDIHIGKVDYIDYENNHIKGYEKITTVDLDTSDNVLKLFYAPIMHKREEYRDEDEVRAIISFESICNDFFGQVYTSEIPFFSHHIQPMGGGFSYLHENDVPDTFRCVPNVFEIDIDLETLIQKVVISPNAKNFFEVPLKELLEKYNINPDKVVKSKI